jgi:sporulation protein YlmC with PRC-barrel domain
LTDVKGETEMKFRRILFTSLTAGALLLSACGDANEGADATPTPVAPVEAAPEVDEVETPVVEVEEVETPAVTESEDMTGTEEITESAEITGAEEMTGAEEITGTEEMTGAEGMTGTEGVTGAEEMTGTEEMTGAEGMTGTEDMTGTEGVAPAETTTDTALVDDVAPADVDAENVSGVVRSSDLLGYAVENFEDEDLGSINDAIVSLDQGCIDYMVLSFGGILGLGDSLYLIPWRAVQIDPVNERLILNVDPALLNDAPIWDDANLPDMTAEDWDADFFGYWEDVALLEMPSADDAMTDEGALGGCLGGPVDASADATAETEETTAITETAEAETSELDVQTPRVIRLSELVGYNVTNTEGEDLGEIEDLMIDWRQDQIAYAILSFGGFLELGEKWFAIPLNELTLDPIEQRLIFDVEPEVLETAPGFDEATLPDTSAPGWDDDIRAFW